jgi:MFS family permease
VLLSLAVMGLATGILQPALYAGVKETTGSRVAAMGFSLLYSVMNLGIMAESFVSPFLRSDGVILGGIPGLNLGIRGVIGCMTLITLGQLVIHLLLFPRIAAAPEVAPDAMPIGFEQAKEADVGKNPILDPRFLAFIFILVPVRTLFAHQWLTVPDYVFNCFPADVSKRYEWFTALNPLVVTLAVPILTHLTGKISVLRMMIVGTAVSASATFLLALPPEAGRLISYIIIFSLGESLWASRFLEYIAQLAPPGRVGAYMGVANLPWFVAKFTTGFYSGLMISWYIPKTGEQNPEFMWTVYGAFACLSPLGLLLGYPWLKAQKSQGTK